MRIIDFVDAGHPALLRMWDKRQRGYRAMGYRVAAASTGDDGASPASFGRTSTPQAGNSSIQVENISNRRTLTYNKTDFVPFSADAQRSIANLEAAYGQLVDIERELDAMPSGMFWQNKNGTEYLAFKKSTADSGTPRGLRSPETERQLADGLSLKPERKPSKKGKDTRQGNVLLDATRHFLRDSCPMDVDFVLELPPELRDLSTACAEQSGFDPTNPSP